MVCFKRCFNFDDAHAAQVHSKYPSNEGSLILQDFKVAIVILAVNVAWLVVHF